MKKKNKQALIIPFIGLKEGEHQFEFEVDSEFFEQFEYSIINKANFKIKILFEKKPSLFNLDFELTGTIYVPCDRCTEEVTLPVSGTEELIVKFGDENFEETDDIKIILASEYELDLTNEIYEYIHLLLPQKIEHIKISDCNQEIIDKLKKLSNTNKATEIVDPRWEALSKLKDKSE